MGLTPFSSSPVLEPNWNEIFGFTQILCKFDFGVSVWSRLNTKCRFQDVHFIWRDYRPLTLLFGSEHGLAVIHCLKIKCMLHSKRQNIIVYWQIDDVSMLFTSSRIAYWVNRTCIHEYKHFVYVYIVPMVWFWIEWTRQFRVIDSSGSTLEKYICFSRMIYYFDILIIQSYFLTSTGRVPKSSADA